MAADADEVKMDRKQQMKVSELQHLQNGAMRRTSDTFTSLKTARELPQERRGSHSPAIKTQL